MDLWLSFILLLAISIFITSFLDELFYYNRLIIHGPLFYFLLSFIQRTISNDLLRSERESIYRAIFILLNYHIIIFYFPYLLFIYILVILDFSAIYSFNHLCN